MSRCCVAPLVSHFSRHIPPRPGPILHGHSSAAMMRGPLSHPSCRQATTFCGVLSSIQGASAWSSCLLSALAMRCVHHIPCLPLATNCTRHVIIPSMHSALTIWSHSTAHDPCSCLASTCSDVSNRPPCFEIFVMEGHRSTISKKNRSFCARRNNATREPLFL